MRLLSKAASLNELAETVQTELNCAAVLITEITDDEQIILANVGLRLPERYERSTPLNYSICQHTVAMNFPLVIDDTVYHPLLKGNLAFPELGIAAYLGSPINVAERGAIGAICALELRRRRWSVEDIELISHAASIAETFITPEISAPN